MTDPDLPPGLLDETTGTTTWTSTIDPPTIARGLAQLGGGFYIARAQDDDLVHHLADLYAAHTPDGHWPTRLLCGATPDLHEPVSGHRMCQPCAAAVDQARSGEGTVLPDGTWAEA